MIIYNRAKKIAGLGNDRSKGDFYPTPESITNALLGVETFAGNILEPCCGEGQKETISAGSQKWEITVKKIK